MRVLTTLCWIILYGECGMSYTITSAQYSKGWQYITSVDYTTLTAHDTATANENLGLKPLILRPLSSR